VQRVGDFERRRGAGSRGQRSAGGAEGGDGGDAWAGQRAVMRGRGRGRRCVGGAEGGDGGDARAVEGGRCALCWGFY
jgi:hypothetical protein